MRKIALLGFAALVAFGFAGVALADTMAETYGNTVLATNDKGETSKLWFKADGTYTVEGAKGEKGSGKWAIKDGKYCSTPNLPADAKPDTPAPKETCVEYQANHKVGDKWTQNDVDGKPVTVEIKKGM
jgi:hypothetical protein